MALSVPQPPAYTFSPSSFTRVSSPSGDLDMLSVFNQLLISEMSGPESKLSSLESNLFGNIADLRYDVLDIKSKITSLH